MSEYVVYLLKNTDSNRTYVGITNNSTRRLRQHNGVLVGGAKYTTAFKKDGMWVYHLHITGLTKKEALSLERTIKNKRKRSKGKTSLEKRMYVINELMQLPKYKDNKIIYYNIDD